MKLKIRTATAEDYLLIAKLGRETFYETWRPVNTEEDMQIYLAKSFDPEKIKKDIIENSTNIFFIAEYNDEPIGYCKMRNDRTYDEFKNEKAFEIERIYVLKSFQRKKVGKQLMDYSIDYARKNNYKWLWLGVNIDNITAIAFYKIYDFKIFGEKAFQLGTAVDNDYLMKKLL
jgi:ribosomal protein S18 acetylase RimI-like enzyme